MGGFSKETRQKIVRDFALKHGGRFDPADFVDEVRETGKGHPAFDWFEWDAAKAAHSYWVNQARDFARDLRVTFRVETIRSGSTISVKTAEMPAVLSPLSGRDKGGGYVLTDPNDPRHMVEHCRQAAAALDAWLGRYGSAVEFAGGSTQIIGQQIKVLKSAKVPGSKKEKAA